MPNHKPSAEYLAGEMPTYDIPDLVEHLKYRILIHENYIGLVVEQPYYYPPSRFGDEDFHLWAIEGYNNTIFYLQGGKEVEKKKWYQSKTVWVNLIAMAAITVQFATGEELIPAEAQVGIVALINVVLRLVTGKPIKWET